MKDKKLLTRDDWFSCSDIYPEIKSQYIFNIYGDVKNTNTNKYMKYKINDTDIHIKINDSIFSILRGIYILLEYGRISINQIPKNHTHYECIKMIYEFITMDKRDKIRLLDVPNLEKYIGEKVTRYLNSSLCKSDIYLDRNKNIWNTRIYPSTRKHISDLSVAAFRLNMRIDRTNIYAPLGDLYKSFFNEHHSKHIQSQTDRNLLITKLHNEGVSIKNICKLLGNVISRRAVDMVLYRNRNRNKKINKTN